MLKQTCTDFFFCCFKFELFFLPTQRQCSVEIQKKKKRIKTLFFSNLGRLCLCAHTDNLTSPGMTELQCFSNPGPGGALSCQVWDVSLLQHTWSRWSARHRALLTVHSSESGSLEQVETGSKNTDLLSCTLCDCKSDFCPLRISSSRAHCTCCILFSLMFIREVFLFCSRIGLLGLLHSILLAQSPSTWANLQQRVIRNYSN